jgi:hypothetical protein
MESADRARRNRDSLISEIVELLSEVARDAWTHLEDSDLQELVLRLRLRVLRLVPDTVDEELIQRQSLPPAVRPAVSPFHPEFDNNGTHITFRSG